MKLQVIVSDDMVKRVDILASSLGLSRSSFCAMLIAQGVAKFESQSDDKNSK